jgi:hypothetical protein
MSIKDKLAAYTPTVERKSIFFFVLELPDAAFSDLDPRLHDNSFAFVFQPSLFSAPAVEVTLLDQASFCFSWPTRLRSQHTTMAQKSKHQTEYSLRPKMDVSTLSKVACIYTIKLI